MEPVVIHPVGQVKPTPRCSAGLASGAASGLGDPRCRTPGQQLAGQVGHDGCCGALPRSGAGCLSLPIVQLAAGHWCCWRRSRACGGEAIALTREDVDLEARTASGQVPAGGVKCLAALVGYIDMSRSRSPLG
jgi:hypothetical protein